MIKIRPASVDDAEIIKEVGAKSFEQAFAEHNSPEDMQKYLTERFSLEHIKEEIGDAHANFFIAFYNDAPVGYSKLILSNPPEKLKNKKAIEMQRIYVLQEYHSMKVGKELMQHAIDYSRQNGYEILWLAVWKLNEKAVAFYFKWGFEIFGERKFTLGNDEKDDHLMMKDLTK